MLMRADCGLRSMDKADAARVLGWRNQDRIRANMYTDHVISVAEHEAWVERALADAQGRYLLFEWRGQPLGFVSITAIDKRHGRAMWAFYLGASDAPKGAGFAMEFLALEYAFETLGLRKLSCEVFVFNASVIKLHGRFGFQQEALYQAHAYKNGEYLDVAGLALFREAWLANKPALLPRGFSA